MKNFFRCYKCGVLNIHGLSACSKCGAPFQYFCPGCGFEIKPGDRVCGNCGNILTWPFEREDHDLDQEDEISEAQQRRKRPSRVIPVILSILILSIIVASAFMIIQLMEKPQPIATMDAVSSQPQSENSSIFREPPKISDIAVDNLSLTSVEISWMTDKPSSSQVLWNKEGEYTNVSQLKEALVNRHSVQLSDLNLNTTYFFKVRSVDQYGNEAVSDQKYFNIGSPIRKNSVVVFTHSMTIDEQPKPVGTRTFIKGQIKNVGDLPVSVRDIRVIINVMVGVQGKAEANRIVATLDENTEKINMGETHNFTALVPNGSQPDYTIEVQVLSSQ